jgi:hypothetical protein
MSEGVLAAAQRFPGRESEVEELAARDEEFRSLCLDFADAEAALRQWEASISPAQQERCAEYRVLIEDLAGEIETALTILAGGR